ncbi:MAG: FMN-binding negative transcriptional regulator [Pirellulaceae bacterium]|nr:FMN-binding negative transcriptional regulator [Pirellulaceae bacterium]
MYIPDTFRESDVNVQHDFIERNSFGLLVTQSVTQPATQSSGSLIATHLPFVLDRSLAPYGVLSGHMARANSQWQGFADQDCLIVFSGPHCYVSPSWYETENMVPTWNYVAVHAYGKVEAVEDHAELLSILRRSVELYESSMPKPWTLGESNLFIERMLLQIVGFRIKIERLEGKWKLSQNHPENRRQKVVHALELQGDENSVAIAELMKTRSRDSR